MVEFTVVSLKITLSTYAGADPKLKFDLLMVPRFGPRRGRPGLELWSRSL